MFNLKKDNHWRFEVGNWAVPPLPDDWKGVTGSILQRAVFDESLGEEVFLLIFDSATGSPPPKVSPPAGLYIRSGVGFTSNGAVIFLLWKIVENSQLVAWYEQFLNPHSIECTNLLRDLCEQLWLKVLIVDSKTGSVIDMAEFPNCYFDEELLSAAIRNANEPSGDFILAQKEFQKNHQGAEFL